MQPATPTLTTCIAPAKVNLCLRVVGRRADGYHLLDSIFATIDFADRIDIAITPLDADASPTIGVRCDYPGVPNDATNLAARAAEAVITECGVRASIAIAIDKRIPPGAGLGGGSSDAAAVLRTLRAAFAAPISDTRLLQMALALGADVPFFLTGGCARVRGIGENVQPVVGWPGLELVLALPPVAVSTAWAFRAYASGFSEHPAEPDRMAASRELDPSCLRNDLEAVVLSAYPEVARAKHGLLTAGAAAAVMSGSGAAVVGYVTRARSARAVAESFRRQHPDVRVQCVRILASGDPALG